MLKFVLDVDINFIHIYAILFVIELGIMLTIGQLKPRAEAGSYTPREVVDMTPWRLAVPTAIVLAAGIVLTYLLFSPWGLVGGITAPFWVGVTVTVAVTAGLWIWSEKRWRRRYAATESGPTSSNERAG